jgi:hypothetical protein
LELGGVRRPEATEIEGGAGGEKKELTIGAHMSSIEKRKDATGEMHKLEEKAAFVECIKGS